MERALAGEAGRASGEPESEDWRGCGAARFWTNEENMAQTTSTATYFATKQVAELKKSKVYPTPGPHLRQKLFLYTY
jgi:hypothetical protein